MTIINEYQNGDYKVKLFDDGTKIRTGEGKSKLPESIDLKITNYCDAGCKWCHEQSTTAGKHANLNRVEHIVEGLPAGVEIAIGGGNPLAHPDLLQLLQFLKGKGLVSNITVNALHLNRFEDLIKMLRTERLIYGLGISYHPKLINKIKEMADANSVIHLIAGVHEPKDAIQLHHKLLILGYKVFGFGKNYYSREVQQNLNRWLFSIGYIMQQCHVSFDNLALTQLGIKQLLKPETWDSLYMGDDGKFTMYVDAVKNEFAVSSTSGRNPLEDMTARKAFLRL